MRALQMSEKSTNATTAARSGSLSWRGSCRGSVEVGPGIAAQYGWELR